MSAQNPAIPAVVAACLIVLLPAVSFRCGVEEGRRAPELRAQLRATTASLAAARVEIDRLYGEAKALEIERTRRIVEVRAIVELPARAASIARAAEVPPEEAREEGGGVWMSPELALRADLALHLEPLARDQLDLTIRALRTATIALTQARAALDACQVEIDRPPPEDEPTSWIVPAGAGAAAGLALALGIVVLAR